MQAVVASLKLRLAELEAKFAAATKNSANSSKPPSSDIVKPSAAARKQLRKKRKRGAQPGHPKHERAAFEPSEIDVFADHALERCPGCGGPLEVLDDLRFRRTEFVFFATPLKTTLCANAART